jgi:hypothetical protein
MERKKALAAAVASTLVVGSAVVAGAAITGISVLGFGDTDRRPPVAASAQPAAARRPRVVTKVRDVYDDVVVDVGGVPGESAPASWPAGAAAAPAVGTQPPEPARPVYEDPRPTPPSPPASDDAPDEDREEAEIPDDWPEGTPLPPIPAGCEEPHLEDAGYWNCQNARHDGDEHDGDDG